MDVLHVQIVSCHGVRHRVVGQALGIFAGHATHVLWVQFDGVVAELGTCGGLQILAAYRQVAVPLHPPVEVWLMGVAKAVVQSLDHLIVFCDIIGSLFYES